MKNAPSFVRAHRFIRADGTFYADAAPGRQRRVVATVRCGQDGARARKSAPAGALFPGRPWRGSHMATMEAGNVNIRPYARMGERIFGNKALNRLAAGGLDQQ